MKKHEISLQRRKEKKYKFFSKKNLFNKFGLKNTWNKKEDTKLEERRKYIRMLTTGRKNRSIMVLYQSLKNKHTIIRTHM